MRHKAEDFGIVVRPDGYCKLVDVLWTRYPREMVSTRQDVERLVREGDKKRFELKTENDGVYIRAVQGP